MADTKADAWARDAVRRAVRSAARSIVAKLDREARDLARWLQKTNDQARSLRDDPPEKP